MNVSGRRLEMKIAAIMAISLILHAAPVDDTRNMIAVNAMRQVGRTLTYDPEYVKLDYPMGDVPIEKGVCTDVIIRALRGINIDLQKEIHEDLKASSINIPTGIK
ncbi:MAG: DUF1287 domain-containing protein [Spirochaetota bacterium]